MSYIIDRIMRIQYELDLVDLEPVMLNDIATIIYGIPRLISEIRIVVRKPHDYSILADTIARVLGMHRYRDRIINALESRGSVALNPVTLPLVYIVIALDNDMKRLIDESIIIKLNGIELRVPRLEHYINYLIGLRQYPYIIDGAALAIIHAERIKREDLWSETIDMLCSILNEVAEQARVFYELDIIMEKASKILCRGSNDSLATK